jgi:hypothetical protein
MERKEEPMTGPVDFSYRDGASPGSEPMTVAVAPPPPETGEGGATLTPAGDGGLDVEFASDGAYSSAQQAESPPADDSHAEPAAASPDTSVQEAALSKDSRPPGFGRNHDVAQSHYDRSKAIFGETEGLYPQSIDPKGNPNDPRNWQTDSWDNLALARRNIGVVAGRNKITWWDAPSKPGQEEAWSHAQDAAEQAADSSILDPKIRYFAIRGDGVTRDFFPQLRRYLTIGPFRNVGGDRDAPAGNNAYVEFYGK